MEALLSVSFGTSYEETRRKTIDAIEDDLRAEFPDLAFYSAWTSGRIIAKVKAERGEHHDTLDEAFARLTEDGVDELIVSTTCLMYGGEMAKVSRAADAWSQEGGRMAYLADPLLSTARDRKAVARAICDEFAWVPQDEALLLMGHGSSTGSNDVYGRLQGDLHEAGRERFFVATVEGEPTFDDIFPIVQRSGAECVHLAPLMIVAGDHATNDLAGDHDDSWAQRISASGLRANPVLKGLGEYAGIRALVCDHARDALMVREVSLRG